MLNSDRIGALLLLAFSIAYGALTFQIPLLPFQARAAFTARTMPEALAVLGILLSLILLIRPGSTDRLRLAGFHWGRGAAVCALMVAYGLTIREGGFLISTSLFLIGGFLVLGERRPVVILGASLPVVAGFWLLMSQLLGVYVAPWPAFLTGN